MPDMDYICGIPECETNMDHDIGGGADNYMPENSTSEGQYNRRVSKTKTCRHCGKSGLHWVNTTDGWRLADPSGNLHKCNSTEISRIADLQAEVEKVRAERDAILEAVNTALRNPNADTIWLDRYETLKDRIDYILEKGGQ